jgi:hypothetical protein
MVRGGSSNVGILVLIGGPIREHYSWNFFMIGDPQDGTRHLHGIRSSSVGFTLFGC